MISILKKKNFVILLILFETLFACDAKSQTKIIDGIKFNYKPIGLPLKISLGTSGLEISIDPSISTPIGTFSISHTTKLINWGKPTRNFGNIRFEENDLLLILRNSRAGNDYCYKLDKGNTFNLVSSGITNITYRNNTLIIDLTEADNYELGLYENNFQKNSISFIEKKEISINSNPEKAKIFLDNVFVGYTPCNLIINSGTHKILLEKENYRNVEEIINPKGPNKLYYNLLTTKPMIKFQTEPGNADIFINGKYSCTSPSTIFLDQGNYKLKIQKKEYRNYSSQLNVYKDDLVSVSLSSINTVSIGFNYSSTNRFGFELIYGKGSLFTLGFNMTSEYSVPGNIKYTFDEESPLYYYDIFRTDSTFYYKHSKVYLNIGINIVNHRLYLNSGIGLLFAQYPFIYRVDRDQNISGRALEENDLICFPLSSGNYENKGFKTKIFPAFQIGTTLDTGPLLCSVVYHYDNIFTSYISFGIALNFLMLNQYESNQTGKNNIYKNSYYHR